MTTIDLTSISLDWNLAAKRLLWDERDDFWQDPLALADFKSVAAKIATGEIETTAYEPSKADRFYVPKPGLTLRETVVLHPFDRLVYHALTAKLAAKLEARRSKRSFAYKLAPSEGKHMFLPYIHGRRAMLKTASELLDEVGTGGYVVVSDVARYFETIQLRRLREQLKHVVGESSTTEEQRALEALYKSLMVWSLHGLGIPQGTDPSSLLGNCLLDRVDKQLERDGFETIRWMDDFYLFAKSESEARRGLIALISHLRPLGLGVNSSKTSILPAEEARRAKFGENPDFGVVEDALVSQSLDRVEEVVPLLIQMAESSLADLDNCRTEARFSLNRLTSLRRYRNLSLDLPESIADRAIAALPRHPSETSTLAKFLAAEPLTKEQQNTIAGMLLEDPLLVYPWQNHSLWLLAAQFRLSHPPLLKKAHQILSSLCANEPDAAGPALFLGRCGDYVARIQVSEAVRNTKSHFVRRCMHIACQELAPDDRTPTYNLIEEDDPHATHLTQHLKRRNGPVYAPHRAQLQMEDLATFPPSIY